MVTSRSVPQQMVQIVSALAGQKRFALRFWQIGQSKYFSLSSRGRTGDDDCIGGPASSAPTTIKYCRGAPWRARPLGRFRLFNLFNQGRNNLEQVAHHAISRNLENGRFGILIDGHDRTRTLHANLMLDGAGNP